ncbi:PHD finger protein 7-like [Corvus hawaiiensis]|uniref:PHD finger protein 7-like n=1 Tax=Corvus hawaiiensis TaxID=134902 RepID=UPI0020186600|nr:PHD finger protein 7-like [Corvus hawaiiensis]
MRSVSCFFLEEVANQCYFGNPFQDLIGKTFGQNCQPVFLNRNTCPVSIQEGEDERLEKVAVFLHGDSSQTRTMAEGKQEASDAREPACLLCRRAEADPDICGDKQEKHGLCAHIFCLNFASLIFRQDDDQTGFTGCRPRDIQLAVSRAAQEHCCVCGETGATIMCCQEDCDRWFHLPCAKEGHCVTQYITPYRSFCPEHCPEQDVRAIPEPGTECPICMEPVEERKSYTTLVCPACKKAWFHRDCIQGQALRAGALYFQCPLCRDDDEFAVQMFVMGIRIPFRQPTWEDNDAFAELGERHSWCNARKCLYPGGREEAEEEGPWELLLCSSCAAEGTHRRCSGLTSNTPSWECDSCAGLGTAPRDEPELNAPRDEPELNAPRDEPELNVPSLAGQDQQTQQRPTCTNEAAAAIFLAGEQQPLHGE